MILSLPSALILSVVGLFADQVKGRPKAGVIVSVFNVIVFVGFSVLVTVFC